MDQLQVSLRRAGSMPSSTSRFKIWLSVLKFDYAPIYEGPMDENMLLAPLKEDCTGMMRIFDGQLREPPTCRDLDCHVYDRNDAQRMMRYGLNHTNVLARFCRGSIPRSCDHVVMNSNYTRPCTLQESFLSSGDYATLELKVTESTALRYDKRLCLHSVPSLSPFLVCVATCHFIFHSPSSKPQPQPTTEIRRKNYFLSIH
jgi:hypothetical protein